MSWDAERLYALLPAIYRIRDADQGDEPLRAFLSVLAEEALALEESVEQLYDDQFIETCAEWVVPYIGDLLGARGLHDPPGSGFSERVQVANTIGYRRRKGTAAVLEQLARDVTGWPANVVEYFKRLMTTQYMNHVRAGNIATPDLRQWEPLERLPTSFDSLNHTLDVRHIANRRGRFNISNVGIFLWRIGAYTSTDAPAYKVGPRRYTFNPLGLSLPLYNQPLPEDAIEHEATPLNVPMPISRRVLAVSKSSYYGDASDRPLSIFVTVNGDELHRDDVVVCNLSDTGATTWAHTPRTTYAIDPVLGRLVLPITLSVTRPPDVRVTYDYGFPADLGGGEYPRGATLDDELFPRVRVPTEEADLAAALGSLGAGGSVEIEDSTVYSLTSIAVPDAETIELRAADGRRPLLRLSADLAVSGNEESALSVNGLLVAGAALRIGAGLGRVTIRHCTLVPGLDVNGNGTPVGPGAPGLVVEGPNTRVRIERSIVGAIRVDKGSSVEIVDSIMDATAPDLVAYAALDDTSPGGELTLENCTVVGRVAAYGMPLVTNSILVATAAETGDWTAPVRAEKRQEGCVRFSSLPPGASVPRRYRCRPAAGDDPVAMRPQFSSQRYGDADYMQLEAHTAPEVAAGADDGSELGAYHLLFAPQREANLRLRLDEYLRFGLEAGIFHAS